MGLHHLSERECQTCGGDGSGLQFQTEPKEETRCPDCNGTGRVGEGEAERCSACGGRGKQESNGNLDHCKPCNSTGFLLPQHDCDDPKCRNAGDETPGEDLFPSEGK